MASTESGPLRKRTNSFTLLANLENQDVSQS